MIENWQGVRDYESIAIPSPADCMKIKYDSDDPFGILSVFVMI